MVFRLLVLMVGWLALVGDSIAQDAPSLARRLTAAIVAAGVPIVGVSIGDAASKTTWKVRPENLQSAAQPTIDAFDVNDPAHATTEQEAQVTAALDAERLASSIVWTLLKQMYPTDTDAQLKTKYGVARTRIIDAYTTQPWK